MLQSNVLKAYKIGTGKFVALKTSGASLQVKRGLLQYQSRILQLLQDYLTIMPVTLKMNQPRNVNKPTFNVHERVRANRNDLLIPVLSL